MARDKPITNVHVGQSAIDLVTNGTPLSVIYRDDLAKRLGIEPKERLTLTLVQDGRVVGVSCLLDDGYLTPEQGRIFTEWLREAGLITVAVMPERPTTS